ncbi:hypothetical protein PMAYCL1PPCAC_30699 [Pristionchus mayeri]|uniref:Fatty acid desaturase domain-containing protein n=1 Tax=Pristionchus mayeri TaxID=1317129 RepID=A0AAN5DET0_9BILA|nr:hypothetical protein PMAYCL1PPCAC_30699 [Pristionchus mayeri]
MSTDDKKKAALANDRFSQAKLPSLDEIRSAIPKECFEKSLSTSIAYMLWDFALMAFLYKIEPVFEIAGYPGMIFWYFLVGMIGFSIFVVGHDCGHGTFSPYTWVNDIFGHVCHGVLFAPYWPWQKTHRIHHTYTSHLTKDMGHPWITDDVFSAWGDGQKFYANNVVTAVVRWFFYTIAGVTDGSHFYPFSRIFKSNQERIQCAVSGLVCVAWATLAFYYFGSFSQWVKFYVFPVLAQGFWLTMVTYLQHQTDDIQVYEDGTWGYVKGQLQTIDRPYGFGIDQLMHHITDGHVAHHLFFTGIPHYNLMKATAAIQEKLKPFGVYRKEKSYDFLWQFASLNRRLEYLVGEGSGLLKYAKSKRED